jgi:hypothetical protein
MYYDAPIACRRFLRLDPGQSLQRFQPLCITSIHSMMQRLSLSAGKTYFQICTIQVFPTPPN